MSTGFRGNRAGSYQQTTFPANRAVITNSEGRIDFSPVTSNEVGYLANARSNIQEQIDEISSDADINSFNIGSTSWVSESTLPYGFRAGSAAVYNGEIHIVGGTDGMYNHYKWNGTSWTLLTSNFLYMNWFGCLVVYNNELHALGGGYGKNKHSKWNGTAWVEVSTIPYNLIEGCAVVYNNEIHVLGTSDGSATKTEHYKWDGTTWTEVSTLPYPFYSSCSVVYNDEIHILGSADSSYYTAHYKWNGTSWSSISTLPYNFRYGSAVVYDNAIHILGSGGPDTSIHTAHYQWNGTSWSSATALPYLFNYGAAVTYKDEIHLLGGYGTSVWQNHYSYKATRWSSNTDSTTSTDYPYIYEIQRGLFTDDSKPIWQLEGVGTITTSTESDEIAKVALAYFSTTGITLYATEQPDCDLVLQVKGV